ncbi:MAG: peptidoglycan-binding protein [Pseudodesulfovibrio sp.]|jgi:hypothetical protein|uniref:Peptidoglycan binding protein n=1 Tax=Pseudodesulfovibrio indicus TaxID=1716143 RepID=A0A140D927_9BACT|nr:peptidoglycan-binding domain-containing protein [Pseudodesulfovibrio indicus]AMK09694.1 hypothetical protein AWY79_00515 [Pseudodesulfovibrio indicus]TDT86350.1 putative peptidoglycan binding protein [Pseudodesulfovibrio indicus]
MRKYNLSLLPLLCGLILAGCVASTTTLTPPPPKVVPTPQVVPPAPAQKLDDIKLVSAALIERLRGGRISVDNVTLDPNGQHAVGELEFNYDGFDVKNVGVTGYITAELAPGKIQAMLEGVILFKDIINRRTGVYFCTQYIVTQGHINITKSVVAGIPPDFPRVETFFIPEDKFKAAASSLLNYTDYYLFAIENAEPMSYGEGESKTGLTGNYYIMTFCKDRIYEEASLNMKVTEKPFGAGKTLADAISINDSGWRILIAGGKFAPGSSRYKFYVGVNYKQDAGGYLPEVVVGEFHNTKREYNPQAAAAQAAPAATQTAPATQAPAPAQSGEGPLALGQQYLNPVFPADVEIIQIRLKDLGLYTGKIDRDFGPLTRKALDAFNQQHGLPKGQWSMGVQKALFQGTGQ